MIRPKSFGWEEAGTRLIHRSLPHPVGTRDPEVEQIEWARLGARAGSNLACSSAPDSGLAQSLFEPWFSSLQKWEGSR